MRRVLAIDIGGTHVKCRVPQSEEKREFDSGHTMTPQEMAAGVRKVTEGWDFDCVTIGLPAPIVHNRPLHDPINLGPGWVDFDFDKDLGKPTKLLNDAAMQAVGSYEGGRMLFLGLGTGLGSCMIADHLILPMELAHLPYRKGKTFEECVGERARERMGKKRWRKHVARCVELLRAALLPDYVVIGGGNAANLKELADGVRLGDNANAFLGGFRLWEKEWARSVPVYEENP